MKQRCEDEWCKNRYWTHRVAMFDGEFNSLGVRRLCATCLGWWRDQEGKPPHNLTVVAHRERPG